MSVLVPVHVAPVISPDQTPPSLYSAVAALKQNVEVLQNLRHGSRPTGVAAIRTLIGAARMRVKNA